MKAYKRGNLPLMTIPMLEVMRRLRDAKAADWPFIYLDDVHSRTLRSLFTRDWIFSSPGHDGVRYTITRRGEDALRVYEKPPIRHNDGLCPDCRTRPKKKTKTGNSYGYCDECQSRHSKRKYALFGHQFSPDSVCPTCKTRPRMKYRNGKEHTYCRECRHARRAQERRRQHDLDLERIRNGEVLLCRHCKEKPRAYTDRYVRDRCHECQRKYMDEYNRKRRNSSPIGERSLKV